MEKMKDNLGSKEAEILKLKAAEIRLHSLAAICKAEFGYTGSTMSMIEILTTLYYGRLNNRSILQVDPARPGWEDQDYLVLSKGQTVIAQYAILADLGFFEMKELDYFASLGSMLQGRPSLKIPGIVSTTVSHGCGLSVACGLAMSLKMDRKNNRVFVILDDEELQNGQVWEAVMAAAHYNLDNLILLIDGDGLQCDGLLKAVMDVGNIQDKFQAFGWKVQQVLDGHDFDQLLDALARAFTVSRAPVCLWCHTIAARGIGFAERKHAYHAVPLSRGEMLEVSNHLKDFEV